MAGNEWNDHHLQQLRTLAEEGYDASDIGKKLNRTTPAVRLKAGSLGIPLSSYRYGGNEPPAAPPAFEVPILPSEVASADEILARREKQFERKEEAKEARRLIPIKINLRGEVGIAHMGDPHVDDDGTDIVKLRRHVDVLRSTDGMLVGNVGDYQNNWVGRIAHLYGQQSTSAAESWVLVEWLIRSMPWLYLIGGNHDAWSGAGDPLKWIAKHSGQLYEPNGARMGLTFPSGRVIRANARHSWPGHSMWNPTHGIGKAIQTGVRDHIVTSGHIHVSGYMILKDPVTSLISHGLQVSSYKTYDRYADEKTMRDQAIFPCPVTIIRPEFADDDPRLITVMLDPEEAADYLTYLRTRKSSAAA